jgi:hypothetical protein
MPNGISSTTQKSNCPVCLNGFKRKEYIQHFHNAGVLVRIPKGKGRKKAKKERDSLTGYSHRIHTKCQEAWNKKCRRQGRPIQCTACYQTWSEKEITVLYSDRSKDNQKNEITFQKENVKASRRREGQFHQQLRNRRRELHRERRRLEGRGGLIELEKGIYPVTRRVCGVALLVMSTALVAGAWIGCNELGYC